MNAIIEQAKKEGTFGVLQQAYATYVSERDNGRSHDKAYQTIRRSYYITEDQFAAMIAEFGEYQPA